MRKLGTLLLVFFLTIGLTACAATAKSVDEDIAKLGEINGNSGNSISKVREKYNSLSDEEKGKVENYQVLLDAEEKYHYFELFNETKITDFKEIPCEKANLFHDTTDTDTWYKDDSAAATLAICFLLEGYDNNTINMDGVDLTSMYRAKSAKEERIDIFSPYENGKIICIQYYPNDLKAKVGTAETTVGVKDYLQMAQTVGEIEGYKDISLSAIIQILSLMG